MKFSGIIVYRNLWVRGMALFPFILLREERFMEDAVIMNHERIHHRQQVEMFIIPFYLAYVFNYFVNRFRYKTHDEAYRNIIFEREAYAMESDMSYLAGRRSFSFFRYFHSGILHQKKK